LKKARAVRRRIIVLNAESPAGGHTGADLSQVELLTALYFRILNCSPELKESDERDIYIQSKGHAVGVITAFWRKPALSLSTGWQPISIPIRICRAIR
jgi:transketolase N-terminal domain/subunit